MIADNPDTLLQVFLNGQLVEIVECFKYLGINLGNELSFTENTGSIVMKATQFRFPLLYPILNHSNRYADYFEYGDFKNQTKKFIKPKRVTGV